TCLHGLLGANIQRQWEGGPAPPATAQETRLAVERSLAWARRSKAEFARQLDRGAASPGQALFGIVQGGIDETLRRQSADALVALDLQGYAIGGLAVGGAQQAMVDTPRRTTRRLPGDRPRYLMGVGTPIDLIESVARGADMFDCVIPTRSGRHGLAFTWAGKVNLKNARHAEDAGPLDPASTCPAARDYSRAY